MAFSSDILSAEDKVCLTSGIMTAQHQGGNMSSPGKEGLDVTQYYSGGHVLHETFAKTRSLVAVIKGRYLWEKTKQAVS